VDPLYCFPYNGPSEDPVLPKSASPPSASRPEHKFLESAKQKARELWDSKSYSHLRPKLAKNGRVVELKVGYEVLYFPAGVIVCPDTMKQSTVIEISGVITFPSFLCSRVLR
jgi:hypothetical protein